MKTLPLFPVAALSWLVAVLLGVAPATAQEDQRFFGRWLPASTSAGGWPQIVEPGRMYNVNDDGEIVYQEHFEIIRDFGERVVVKSWPVEPLIEGASTAPSLMTFQIMNRRAYQILEIKYCSIPAVNAFFFEEEEPDKIWARIVEWSKKDGEYSEFLGRFRDFCVLDPETLDWLVGGMGFYRELPSD